jgi:hypothetical protein
MITKYRRWVPITVAASLAVGAFLSVPAASAQTASPAALALFNCWNGPHGRNTPHPGQPCWQGALNLDIPRHNAPPDTGWTMMGVTIHGILALQVTRHWSAATGVVRIVFVGWVVHNVHTNWPFRNPLASANYPNWPVIQVRWSPRGRVNNNLCIDAATGQEFHAVTFGACSHVGQGASDPFGSDMVFRPGQRLNSVKFENASSNGTTAFCVSLPPGSPVESDPILWELARGTDISEHNQQWHFSHRI